MKPTVWAALPAFLLGCGGAAPQPGVYPIAVEPVDELCLAGPVDAGWAAGLLGPEGLVAAAVDGAPSASVCATASSFLGKDFAEAVFGLTVEGAGSEPDLFLVRALNSVRFFAWVERTRNRSPYGYGAVTHSSDPAALSVLLATADGEVLRAGSTHPPGPASPAVEVFEGRVLQPGRSFFYARLEGALTRRPFVPGDTFAVGPDAADPFAAALRASGFTPVEWRIRPAGRHAKTDTVQLPPDGPE